VYYQVVSRPATPGASWNYYPSWTPIHEREVAERMARSATLRGHEAVILEQVTVDRLGAVARSVVERQETRHLPATRYLPTAETLLSPDAQDRVDQEIVASLFGEREWSVVDAPEEPSASEADQARLALEEGPGGDVTARMKGLNGQLAFPTRKDVLRTWLSLWARAAAGEVGGPDDGATRD
jgi:hypothetical protein